MKILIADDHWVVREALKQLMKKMQKSLQPLEAASFGDAIDILSRHPDVEMMLVDLVMPGFAEFDGLRMLRQRFPMIPTVVVSVHEDRDHVLQAIQQGVIGYIPKTAEPEEIVQALSLALSGQVAFPRRILESCPVPPSAPNDAAAGAEARISNPVPCKTTAELLTLREKDVLRLLGEGRSVARIAEDLGLSPNTVRVHVANIMRKLHFKNRAQVVHYAVSSRGLARQTR